MQIFVLVKTPKKLIFRLVKDDRRHWDLGLFHLTQSVQNQMDYSAYLHWNPAIDKVPAPPIPF